MIIKNSGLRRLPNRSGNDDLSENRGVGGVGGKM
jgi:hypothetical protein